MARLNIAERRLPQDGRIQLKAQGKEIDMRVSTVPTMHGESVVMRLLDKNSVNLDLSSLGFFRRIILVRFREGELVQREVNKSSTPRLNFFRNVSINSEIVDPKDSGHPFWVCAEYALRPAHRQVAKMTRSQPTSKHWNIVENY